MAGQTDFKHIQVTPADDEDVVIYAGAPREEAASGEEGAATREASAGESVQASGARESAAEAARQASAPADAAQVDAALVDAAKRENVQADAAQADAAKRENAQAVPPDAPGYHPTTLEDIEGFKMSRTQIVIIALALIAVIAFAVWYVVVS